MTPFFSVIVPTRDRPDRLVRCLRALARLDYPGDAFEVVVVDDGSRIAVEQVVEALQTELQVSVLRTPACGPAAARNVGVANARGEYVAFTDDDCIPRGDWLTALARRFAEVPEAVIGGDTVNGPVRTPCAEATQLLLDYLSLYYNADPDDAHFLTSNNLALRREAFVEIGGFDAGFPTAAGEDRELVARLHRLGRRVMLAPEVIVLHQQPKTLRSFWRQHVRYGRGAYRFQVLETGDRLTEISLEPPRFYLDLFARPFRDERSRVDATRLSLLLGLSQVANAAGFGWEARRRLRRRTRARGAR